MGSAECPALPSQLLSLALPVGCRVRGWLGLIARLLSLGSHPSHWGTCSIHPPSRTPPGCLRCRSCTPSTGRYLATPLAPLSWCCMVVQMDQRGCGKSTPHAELEDNNTQALVGDIE